MEPSYKLEGVNPELHDRTRQFAATIASIFAPALRGISLFGAATSATFHPKRDSIRSVLVVDKTDLSAVSRLGKQGPGLAKQHFAAPWVLSPSQINSSLDTFPLELLEIQQEGKAIFGQDFFRELVFQESHVRLQCEREIKTALIALQQGLLACAGDEKLLARMAEDGAFGLTRTLRGLLWLLGVRERRLDRDRVTEIEKACGRTLGGLKVAMNPEAHHNLATLESLYHDVEALGEYVNAR